MKSLNHLSKSFDAPRLIIMAFTLILTLAVPIMGLQTEMLYSQAITRIGMYCVLVLAMVPAIESGIQMNMALSLGILSGLFGGVISMEIGLNGLTGMLAAMLFSLPFSIITGILYGMVLNKIKGSEMTIATYTGYTSVALMCIVWLALPVKNPEIRWPQGNGVRSMVSLTGKYEQVLDKLWQIQITDEFIIPTGLILFVVLICFIVWLFLRSKTGIMMKAGGSNPKLAAAHGINYDRTRILGMTLSTVLGSIGIIIYSQSYGFFQFYMAPQSMPFIAVAAILIGGATLNKASIFNVILGTVLYEMIMTFSLPIANVVMPEGNLSEITRIIVQNGIILYALTKAGGKK